MTKVKKALLVALPTVALVIGGGAGIAAAIGGQPTAPVTSTVQQQAPGHGDQVRLRDGSCVPPGDQDQVRDQDRMHDRDQIHDPIHDRDRLHADW